jgi:hypothetical protein
MMGPGVVEIAKRGQVKQPEAGRSHRMDAVRSLFWNMSIFWTGIIARDFKKIIQTGL